MPCKKIHTGIYMFIYFYFVLEHLSRKCSGQAFRTGGCLSCFRPLSKLVH